MLTTRPIKKLIEKTGAKRVSRKAAEELAKILEERTKELSKRAATLASYARRTTVMKQDIKLAKKYLEKPKQ